MNLIDYNKVMKALDKERQFLLNREQYGAENVLVKHALNIIAEMPVIRQPEIVRCRDCQECYYTSNRVPSERTYSCGKHGIDVTLDWFCADGKLKEGVHE